MQELQNKVIQWAEDKGIFAKSDPISQFLKTISEVGELADAVNKNDLPAIKDAIGDITVTLILHAKMKKTNINLSIIPYTIINAKEIVLIMTTVDLEFAADYGNYDDVIERLASLAKHYGWTLQECLQSAYDVISKRTGKMENSVFIKDEK